MRNALVVGLAEPKGFGVPHKIVKRVHVVGCVGVFGMLEKRENVFGFPFELGIFSTSEKGTMEHCLDILVLARKELPEDDFLGQAVDLLQQSGCTVRKFYALCLGEIQRSLGGAVAPPYICQNNWIHNLPLVKAMVHWIQGGRQGAPQKVGKSSTDQVGGSSSVLLPPAIAYQPGTVHDLFWLWGWRIWELWTGQPAGRGLNMAQQSTLLAAAASSSSTSTSLPPFNPPTLYPSQLQMGWKLLEAVSQTAAMKDSTFSGGGVDFRIVVPPKVSLAKQTRERLFYLLWEYLVPPGVDKTALQKLMVKTHALGQSVFHTGSNNNAFNKADPLLWKVLEEIKSQFSRRVLTTHMFRKGVASGSEYAELCKCVLQTDAQGRRKRVLIIGDEAHFGVGRNGQVDVLFNGAKHSSGSDPNWLNPLCEPNVVIVHVSATCWNLEVVPHFRVLDWSSTEAAVADDGTYVSWDAYARGRYQDKALLDSDFDQKVVAVKEWLSQNAHPSVRGVLLSVASSLVLMLEYGLEFWRLLLSSSAAAANMNMVPSSPATQRIVEQVLAASSSSTGTILIRVQRGGIQAVFARWLKVFRSLVSTKGSYQVACPSYPAESDLQTTVSSVASRLATLVVVVERGRVGDTFSDLKAFDLRARYGSALSRGSSNNGHGAGSTASFSSFIQDAGRCFGYRSVPPLLVLNQRGFQLLRGETYKLDTYVKTLPSWVCRMRLPGLATCGSDLTKECSLLPAPRSLAQRLVEEKCLKALKHMRENRILFYAGSQQGKTGAFIALIALFLSGAKVGEEC